MNSRYAGALSGIFFCLAVVAAAQYVKVRVEISDGVTTNAGVVTITRVKVIESVTVAASRASTNSNPGRRAADLTKVMLLDLHNRMVDQAAVEEGQVAAEQARQAAVTSRLSNRVEDVEAP